ncbi:MAG TPA: hypothetical protein VFS67_34505 [Polyangiaceae bacterium]|jgi:hypothetical protein|nr:hypothetical protein [Polyangiaceae bacterium]
MAPAEFFNAAWSAFVPASRMREQRADAERSRGATVEGSMIVEERTVALSRVLAGRVA